MSIFTSNKNLELSFTCTAKFRYRQEDTEVTVNILENNSVKIIYDKPVRAVTPGQAVVFYKNDICLAELLLMKCIKIIKK